jgi:hypothetical protein
MLNGSPEYVVVVGYTSDGIFHEVAGVVEGVVTGFAVIYDSEIGFV